MNWMMQYDGYCSEGINTSWPSNPKLATAYVPFQQMQYVYTPEKGLKQGTIFPELDRPYGADPEYLVDA